MSFSKDVGYTFFAFNYSVMKHIAKPDKKRVFAVAKNDMSDTGNIMTLINYMKKKGSYSFFYYTRREQARAGHAGLLFFIDLLFNFPWHMAGSGLIILDDEFLPMGYCRIRKETKVIQLWHGTGSLKKFGQDSNTGKLLDIEKRIDANIDRLAVNADCEVEQYSGAFGISTDKIKVTGLPRTDWLVSLAGNSDRSKRMEAIKNNVEMFIMDTLVRKYVILFAPTFRDSEVNDPKLHMDIAKLIKNIPDNAIILVRLHPFVEKAFRDDLNDESFKNRVYNVSEYPSLNELLAASDALITDYSSIFFDFAILDRPIFFFADDLQSFITDGRGLYMDYKNDVPGPVSEDEESLAVNITEVMEKGESEEEKNRRHEFVKKYYKYTDGRSAERVYENCVLQ